MGDSKGRYILLGICKECIYTIQDLFHNSFSVFNYCKNGSSHSVEKGPRRRISNLRYLNIGIIMELVFLVLLVGVTSYRVLHHQKAIHLLPKDDAKTQLNKTL